MVMRAALWGLGYAALLVATLAYGWHAARRYRSSEITGHVLITLSVLLLWAGLAHLLTNSYGWPLVSPADRAIGIALLMLLIYIGWELWSPGRHTGFAVAAIALLLLSYGLSRSSQEMISDPITSAGVVLGAVFGLCGGSLLALATAVSLTELASGRGLVPPTARPDPFPAANGDVSEMLVRGALLCLAISLAIDTWWLQKVGMGSGNDAQQAGIAIAWMVYFVALRLRSSPRWRGWPWTFVLAVGFICVLPILIDAPWLESSLPI